VNKIQNRSKKERCFLIETPPVLVPRPARSEGRAKPYVRVAAARQNHSSSLCHNRLVNLPAKLTLSAQTPPRNRHNRAAPPRKYQEIVTLSSPFLPIRPINRVLQFRSIGFKLLTAINAPAPLD